MNGALRIVLMRRRSAEDRHHRVTDELLHRAAISLDLLPQPSVIGPDPRPDVLGVSRFRRRREADEVAEQHRHDLALLLHPRRGLRGQRRRTERTERKLTRKLPTAGRACRHARSLWSQPAGTGHASPDKADARSSETRIRTSTTRETQASAPAPSVGRGSGRKLLFATEPGSGPSRRFSERDSVASVRPGRRRRRRGAPRRTPALRAESRAALIRVLAVVG